MEELALTRKLLKASPLERTESDVEDAFPTLSVSDFAECTIEGAALVWRDHRRGCVPWLDCPVLGERVSNDGCMLLSPEAVLEDIAFPRGVRALVITGTAGPDYHPYQAVRLITCRRQLSKTLG